MVEEEEVQRSQTAQVRDPQLLPENRRPTPQESQQGTRGRRRPGQGVVVRENNRDQ